jgi:hypothetical protein
MVEGDVNQAKKSFMGMPVSLFRSSHVHQGIIFPIDPDALHSSIGFSQSVGRAHDAPMLVRELLWDKISPRSKFSGVILDSTLLTPCVIGLRC